MKVFYRKNSHVTLQFGSGELKQALGVLRALATHFKLAFMAQAADDIERDFNQPALGYVMQTRLCEACKMEVDLHSDNKHETEVGIFHKKCPQLKQPLTIRDL